MIHISTFLLEEYFSIPVTIPILIIQWDLLVFLKKLFLLNIQIDLSL